MNILILFSQPWRVGGAETHIEALIKGLSNHSIFLAVNEGSDNDKLDKLCSMFKNLHIIKIQARGINIFRWYNDIGKLRKIIEQEKIDVITAQQRTAGIWAYLLHRHTNIPYTVTMHDPWHRAKIKSIYAGIFPVIFAVSDNLAKTLQDKFGFKKDQIKIINNGIDFTSFIPSSKEKARQILGLPLEGKLILHVSRLSNIKGAVSLKIIDAMQDVIQKQDDVKLIIIGEGPLRSNVEEKILKFNRLNGNKIEIKNFVDNIINWYNACDILIGEGRVAMETLACEKPIVAIRNAENFIGAITKENIAYACDVNFDGNDKNASPENIANEIMTAFCQDEMETKQIVQYIKSRLGIDHMVNDYLRVFKLIVK